MNYTITSVGDNFYKAHMYYPPPLYKFIRRQHLESFLRSGEIAIGTLSDFRRIEHNAIGDQNEGVHDSYFKIEESGLDLHGDDPEALFLRDAMSDYPSGVCSGHLIGGPEIHVLQPDPDAYVYCASTELDWNVLRRFGYDACLEISYPLGFVSALNVQMSLVAKLRAFGPVIYGECRHEYNDMSRRKHAGLIKDPSFSYQKEARALWLPPDNIGTLSRKFISVPDARQFCREIPVPPDLIFLR